MNQFIEYRREFHKYPETAGAKSAQVPESRKS